MRFFSVIDDMHKAIINLLPLIYLWISLKLPAVVYFEYVPCFCVITDKLVTFNFHYISVTDGE